MTATLNDVTKKKVGEPSAEQQAAAELVRLATEQGLSLTGPDGLLNQLTKAVLETALNEELTEHLGYAKHDPAGAGSDNVRNGSRPKTVLTDATGHVQIDVPRDRARAFEPQIDNLTGNRWRNRPSDLPPSPGHRASSRPSIVTVQVTGSAGGRCRHRTMPSLMEGGDLLSAGRVHNGAPHRIGALVSPELQPQRSAATSPPSALGM